MNSIWSKLLFVDGLSILFLVLLLAWLAADEYYKWKNNKDL